MSSTLTSQTLLDPTEPAVAIRLARLLEHHRKQRGWSRRDLAKLSGDRWTSSDLKQVEAGRWPLDQSILSDLAALYEVDVTAVLPARTAVVIDQGLVSIGGLASVFEPWALDSLLTSYLVLVRRVRRQERLAVIDLRRTDVETLAAHLDVSGEQVVSRLGELMGVNAAQRRAMAQMFTTGMAVIVLTVGAVGIGSSTRNEPTPQHGASPQHSATLVLDGISSAGNEPLQLTLVDGATAAWNSAAIDDLVEGSLLSPAIEG
jgi:transcriptional regulator with XRE-family HTH domain